MNHVVPSMIQLAAIAQARLSNVPFPFFIGSGFLDPHASDDLARDFPTIHRPGDVPVSEVMLRGSLRQLVGELESPELTKAVSARIGNDLSGRRRVVTIRKYCSTADGRAATESKAKIASLLIHLNDAWSASEGARLRVLRGPDDLDDVVAEIPPAMGTIFGFRRTDNSWHGHKPYAGERRLVQVAWLHEAAAEPEPAPAPMPLCQRLKSLFSK
jgi:hypothetical protein